MSREVGVIATALLGAWLVLALLVVSDPRRFFRILGLGRTPPLPERLVPYFRVLGLINAVGSAYILLTHRG